MRVSPSLHKKNPALWRNWWGSHHPHCRNRCLAMTSSFEIILDTWLLFVTGLFVSTNSWNWLVKVQKLMIRQRLSKEKPLESFCFSRSRCEGGWWQLLKCHLWGLVLDLQVRLYRVGFSRVSTSLTNQRAAFWNAELSLVNWRARRLEEGNLWKFLVVAVSTQRRLVNGALNVVMMSLYIVWLEHLMVMSLYTFSTITAIYE